MPNHPIAAGLVVVTVAAVAAAIAVYESPQARQFAEDVRRRIALALHSLGDDINPNAHQPRFNRPEDAEGFMQSGGNNEMAADEESQRRQREELMYWNAVNLERKEKERKLNQERPRNSSRGSAFEDFLHADPTAEKGTYVYNTGTDLGTERTVHRRGGGSRSMVYSNPFADEHHIDLEDHHIHLEDHERQLISPDASEEVEPVSEELYTASESFKHVRNRESATTLVANDGPEGSGYPVEAAISAVPDPPISVPGSEEDFGSQELPSELESSINAWASSMSRSNPSFYSPLPTTPRAASPQRPQSPAFSAISAFSDPDYSIPGSGAATPTNSEPEEVWAPRSGATSDADVMSLNGDAINTPDSWTEVGSVVSEDDLVGEHH